MNYFAANLKAFRIENNLTQTQVANALNVTLQAVSKWENEIARNRNERSELDYLIYNTPLEYADFILNGDPKAYLQAVTEYILLD